MARAPARVAGVYLLQREDVSEPRVDSLGLADAVSTIVEHGFDMADEPSAIARQAFERATALAAVTPVGRLVHAPGLEHLEESLELLARLDEGPSA
jgi:hypothetical protein